jgi:hypothetical protein
MRILLRDLAPGQDYAMSFRSNDGNGNVSEWSYVQRFTTTNDTIAPSQPQSLSWYDSGSAFIADWEPVTTQASTPVSALRDFRYYRVNVAATPDSPGVDFFVTGTHFELSKELNKGTFGTLQTALTVKVYCVDMTYNESVPATATVNPFNPPVPSIPTVDLYLGALRVKWDGLSSAATAMPDNFNYCEVHVGTTDNFTVSLATLRGRIVDSGSAGSTVITELAYDTDYWVRLVAVNELSRKSNPSNVSAKIRVSRLSGLDIDDGTLTAEQINWTAVNLPGAKNAYYSTSQPTDPIGEEFQIGDLWYDKDDYYTVYKWDGTTWVLAPEIGFIPGTKIVGGTITGDRIAANFFDAAYAHIGTSFIDELMVTSVNAGSITTGNLRAGNKIMAGPELDNHAEMTSQGFYVYTQSPMWTPENPIVVTSVKMGTGDGDTFSIPDPNTPDATLASISSSGVGSFQDIYSVQSPTIAGTDLLGNTSNIDAITTDKRWMPIAPRTGGWFTDNAFRPVASGKVSVQGLEPGGTAGIRGEYGIAQFRVPVVAGRTYLIHYTPPIHYVSGTGNTEVRVRIREQKDTRPIDTQIAASNTANATTATITSRMIDFQYLNSLTAGWYMNHKRTFVWKADYTGYSNMMLSFEMIGGDSTSTLKIPNSDCTMDVFDLGTTTTTIDGLQHSGGGSMYSYTPPPPPPPPAPVAQNYYWESRPNWVRSYKSNNAWMTNDGGRAYQGVDPSGYNGNQHSLIGWNGDIAAMLSGAWGITVHLYVYFAHWYYNSGGIAVIGSSGQWGDPGGGGSPGYWANRSQVGGVPKPGSFEADISYMAGEFQGGSTRSIAFGTGPSTSYNYYGYATDFILKIWYTK